MTDEKDTTLPTDADIAKDFAAEDFGVETDDAAANKIVPIVDDFDDSIDFEPDDSDIGE